jgi:rhamnose utilization protein RhaD (predicted bifunctional aldolase and dehydrogenase)
MTSNLAPLIELSSRIGRDLDLVQAGGGNTSVKHGGTLWVKASGKWLAHAAQDEMFVPAPIPDIMRYLEQGCDYTVEQRRPSGAALRPSVETAMHAVLPHRVVIHVHSVRTIAWSVRINPESAFTETLDGIRWEWIPYIHPGWPLARNILDRLSSRPDVLILGNHGLVVGGDDCDSAEWLLREVEQRLDIKVSAASEPDSAGLVRLAEGTEWRIADNPEVHALGTNRSVCDIASRGTMYPDHCVYLGPAAAVLGDGESISDAVARYRQRYDYQPTVLLVPQMGVLTSNRLTLSGAQLLICLKRVAERIVPEEGIHYLEDVDVARLMNWDAEKYRIAMSAQQSDSAPHS